jgi:hypothetical protein
MKFKKEKNIVYYIYKGSLSTNRNKVATEHLSDVIQSLKFKAFVYNHNARKIY